MHCKIKAIIRFCLRGRMFKQSSGKCTKQGCYRLRYKKLLRNIGDVQNQARPRNTPTRGKVCSKRKATKNRRNSLNNEFLP